MLTASTGLFDEFRVNVDCRHIVHDAADFQAFFVGENVLYFCCNKGQQM
jgi:hypothetical protein